MNLLHNGTAPGPHVLCGELRARVQHTKYPAVWEGAVRTGTACRACDGKHLLNVYRPLIWPQSLPACR